MVHICLTYTLLLLILFCANGVLRAEECTASFHLNENICAHEMFQISVGWNTASICDGTKQNNISEEKCRNFTTCGRNLRVSVFDQQLFSITMKNIFINMLTSCCKSCALCSVKEIEDTLHVNDTILQSSDVIFPVLGESNVQRMNGFYFLPSYRVPSSYYFTMKKSSTLIVEEVVIACLNLWPFLLICLLFAFISGFLVWIIEHRSDRGDFPKRFYGGIFDGFWWSFISMTTVGYGDKVTRSYLGKAYAVFWILIGITMSSMFTATLTSEIINARTPASTDLGGKDVAVMKGRPHDIQIVADKGGVIHLGRAGHTMRGIDEMIDLLEKGGVNGFVVDRNTYYHFTNRIKEPRYAYISERLAKVDMVRTEKKHSHESLSCGMLFRNLDDFTYFKAYFDNNRLDIRSCNSMRMNTKDMEDYRPPNMFSSDSEIFETVLIWSISIVAVMVFTGLAIEAKRYYVKVKTDDCEDKEDKDKC